MHIHPDKKAPYLCRHDVTGSAAARFFIHQQGALTGSMKRISQYFTFFALLFDNVCDYVAQQVNDQPKLVSVLKSVHELTFRKHKADSGSWSLKSN
jgi:hypothetical protein